MKGREEKSTKYLYTKDGDALFVSYVDKKNSGKETLLPFQQCIQVSVFREMSERNLMFTRFMITQKEVLMWSISYLLINLKASSLPDGRWIPSIFCLILFEQIQKFYSLNLQNLMLCQYLNLIFVFESSLFFQSCTIALKIVTATKVLPCTKLDECFASEISIALSEMLMNLLVDVVYVLAKLPVQITTNRNVEIPTSK